MNMKDVLRLVFSRNARIQHGAWISWASGELARHRESVIPQNIERATVALPPVDRDGQEPIPARQAQPENLNADFESFVTSNKWVQK